jgi:hypothetical protein
MRKPIAKLALCKETVRALINTDLSQVRGGQDGTEAEVNALSGQKQCPAPEVRPNG